MRLLIAEGTAKQLLENKYNVEEIYDKKMDNLEELIPDIWKEYVEYKDIWENEVDHQGKPLIIHNESDLTLELKKIPINEIKCLVTTFLNEPYIETVNKDFYRVYICVDFTNVFYKVLGIEQ